MRCILAACRSTPHAPSPSSGSCRRSPGTPNGAQRVAWTDTWEQARAFLRAKVEPTGATELIDEAGNQWFTLEGASERVLVIGGHMDSVPNGGWLDGCLNVLAASRCCGGSPRRARRR